ncbi:protein MA [Vigna unguiculata]|uniref:Protein MA n=1 Tax=Vigna unguiculata TaxID=3917 RepID=A0A4D6NB80_VIGUN|nr:protein MA [Vigna unguiculata]
MRKLGFASAAHKGNQFPKLDECAINDLVLHSSSDLTFTVAHDNFLVVVNLDNGRCKCRLCLDKEATLVMFNASSDHFFMAAKEKVSIHQTRMLRMLQARSLHYSC